MSRRRTAANPYLPAETNPFGQQQNPFVPTNENIEQGVALTEPEGPRVVTRPDTPQTAKPRGEGVIVDASLDRLKVAVVCEGCGQRGLLRLGQVSDSTRCRCGSARVELLEASRKIAEKECTCWEGYERVPGTEPCEKGSCRKKTSLRTTSNKVYKVEVWGYEDYEDSDSLVANSNTYTDYTVIVAAPDAETARWAAIEYSDGDGLIDPDAQVLEDLTGSSVRIDITAGSKPKKRAHRLIASEGWMKSLNPHHRYKTVVKNGYELNLFASDVDYRWTVDAMVTGDSSSLELFEQGIGTSLEDAKRQAEQSAQFFQG